MTEAEQGQVPVPPAALRLVIDRTELARNWRRLASYCGPTQVGVAVKANAYGLGVEKVAPVLRRAGARQFYVAHWSEVPPLLRHAPAAEISVLHGVANGAEAAFAMAVGVRPVLNSLHQVSIWLQAGGGDCDLMLDCGINRLGVPPREWGNASLQQLNIDTLMAHLSSADEDVFANETERLAFASAVPMFTARRRSIANSAGVALGQLYHHDLVRPGLALYGGIPRERMPWEVRQVAYPQTSVLQLRDLEAGDRVGYNGTFVADRQLLVATVALGYADGYLRAWGNGAGVLRRNGLDYPVIGRVSMDLVVVQVPDPTVREGDWLDVPYALPQAAATSGLSQYELLTLLGNRFDR